MNTISFTTPSGITITRTKTMTDPTTCLKDIYADIDNAKGCVLASDYEYPGRYSRWDIATVDPPIELKSQQRNFQINALNDRGRVILPMLAPLVTDNPHVQDYHIDTDTIQGRILPMPDNFSEEQRSKQPSIFSILRKLTQMLHCDDEYFTVFGAFGYDLVFQFEPINFKHPRPPHLDDCHLFLADRIRAIDHQKQQAFELLYDFSQNGRSTQGIPITGQRFPLPAPQGSTDITSDHTPGSYAEKVEKIRQGCRQGDFFEVVLSQVFSTACPKTPTDVFKHIRQTNPSPYGFLFNLGNEQLIGGSPEMFVRVDDKQVETCPISGTVRRGTSPMEDHRQIMSLLNSKKDESELTMCTDVDRNDKSRVCVPGSVKLVGRRLVETYSRLFHTVDHVKGTLNDDCDMFDAFLSHMWACTLTGSPKPIAMQTIENLENSSRHWYGGCVGLFTFNDQLNTGITIRTVHLQNGRASVRAGATLLFDSVPKDEEKETHVKASAFLNAVTAPPTETASSAPSITVSPITPAPRVLFVDNQDSFVHTIANYVRQTQAEVITYRNNFDHAILDTLKPDLVFISPGPCTPRQMGVPQLVEQCVKRSLPIFGVCLGHQGIAEYFGAELGVLETPMHGKESPIHHNSTGIFQNLPTPFHAGRYHSLFVKNHTVPDCFDITAQTEDNVIMAIQHKTLPIASVQFHPESILTLHDNIGLKLIHNAIEQLTRPPK